FVDFDHNISSAVNKLRTALNDSARQPHYIETAGRRGYRFLYPVTLAKAASAKNQPVAPQANHLSRNWVIAAFLTALMIIGAGMLLRHRPTGAKTGTVRSIAVLPLKNLSSDAEQEYFSEGLTDELITRLASLQGLRVISS